MFIYISAQLFKNLTHAFDSLMITSSLKFIDSKKQKTKTYCFLRWNIPLYNKEISN